MADTTKFDAKINQLPYWLTELDEPMVRIKDVLAEFDSYQKQQQKQLKNFEYCFVKLAQVIRGPGWDLETIEYWLDGAQKKFKKLKGSSGL